MKRLSCILSLLWVSLSLCGKIANAAEILAAKFEGVAENREFPAEYRQVVNVKAAPYSARGDGQTDDTAAIQQALNDMMGQHKILFFPTGTYLVSAQLSWANQNSEKQPAWGYNWITRLRT